MNATGSAPSRPAPTGGRLPSYKPPGGAKPPSSTSPFLKVLIGCGIGCGVLIVLFLVAGGIGFFWAFFPGEQHATAAIATPETPGVIHLARTTSDPGVMDFADRFIRTMQEVANQQSQQNLPESMRWLQEMQNNQATGIAGISWMLPREVTLIGQPPAGDSGDGGGDGDLSVVVAANLSAFPRLIRTFVRSVAAEDGQIVEMEYAGHRVDRFSEDAYLSFIDGTLLWSDELAALEDAIDRIEASGRVELPEAGGAGGTGWGGRLGSVPAERLASWDLYGSLSREADPDVILTELLPILSLEQQARLPALQEAVFGIDVVSSNVLTLDLELDTRTQQEAEQWLTELRSAARGYEGDMELYLDGSVEGNRASIRLDVTGLESWIDRTARALDEPDG